MGMSSSQARLLNLTARMHQIEYKAAKLEAQKLQMANESRRVYDNYLQALDAKKIQFATLTTKGSIDYADATLAGLENAIVHDTDTLTSTKAYLLQNARTNEVYLTQKVADALGFDTDFPATKEAYIALHESEIPKVEVTTTVPDYSNIVSVTPVENGTPTIGTHGVTTYSYSMDPAQIASIPASAVTCNQEAGTYWSPEGEVNAPNSITSPVSAQLINRIEQKNTVPSGYTAIRTPADLAAINGSGNYILMEDIDVSGTEWTPIASFSGVLDGNGHKITGLNNTLFNNFNGTARNLETVSELPAATYNFFANTLTGANIYIENCNITGHQNGQNATSVSTFGQVYNCGLHITDTYINVSRDAYYGLYAITGSASNCSIDVDNVYYQMESTGNNIFCSLGYNGTATNGVPTFNSNNGTISGAYAWSDIKNYLAYQMYSTDHNHTYDEYFEYLDGMFGSDNAAYVSFSCNIGGDDESSMITSLLSDYNNHNAAFQSFAEEYASYDIINQKSAGQFNVIEQNIPATHTASAGNRDDIVNSLAYAVYQTKLSNGSINNQTSIDAIRNTINSFSDQQLASLTANPAQRATIVSALANNCTIASVQSAGVNTHLYDGYTINFAPASVAPLNSSTSTTQVNNDKGTIEIPDYSGIGSNLVVAFRKAGKTINNEAQVTTNVYNKVTSNYAYAADLNDYIAKYLKGENDGSKIDALYNYIMSGGSQVTLPAAYNHSTYDATQVDKGNCIVQYGTKEQGTGEMVIDTTSSEYQRLSNEYDNLITLRGTDLTFKIIDDELANSVEYLNTLLDNDSFVLIDFSKGLGENLTHTNISVETNLQEVSDETLLRKAEAQYEADMRKIDAKDRKYDIELAALDNERNAIKSEMETLKTVAKDNVERTFKLFG